MINEQWLLELADILEVADEAHAEKSEPAYDQTFYAHSCGAPGCALSHWAVAHPDRWYASRYPVNRYHNSGSALTDSQEEFSLSFAQARELFDYAGCGGAKTAKQAAAYIRSFVERNT